MGHPATIHRVAGRVCYCSLLTFPLRSFSVCSLILRFLLFGSLSWVIVPPPVLRMPFPVICSFPERRRAKTRRLVRGMLGIRRRRPPDSDAATQVCGCSPWTRPRQSGRRKDCAPPSGHSRMICRRRQYLQGFSNSCLDPNSLVTLPVVAYLYSAAVRTAPAADATTASATQ